MRLISYFPTNIIAKGANIVLYGAGKNGSLLYDKNKKIDWCKIKAVSDREYNQPNIYFKNICNPQAILEMNYDYVLISIVNEGVALSAKRDLIKLGIDENRIIMYKSHFNLIEYDEKCVMIGFRLAGGMGDYIMQLKVYQQIIKLAPNCIIDVIAERPETAVHIYYGQNNLRNIVEGFSQNQLKERYDLFIEMSFEIGIGKYNADKVEKYTPKLKKAIDKLEQYNKRYFVGMPIFQYTNHVLVGRAKIKGWNRYTQWSCSGAFNIDDMKVEMYIEEAGEKGFYKYKFPYKYITYNFGADDFLKDGKRQMKMWPFEYHIEFNRLFKINFPDIMLVQLGGKNAEPIPGADKYIFGENLEIVKVILKNSMLHFDCEGGLVHLATQLGTKCCVVFGPTPMWFLGYEQNINIPPRVCGECKGLIKEWFTTCYMYEKPECMYSIKPEDVIEKISKYLKGESQNVKEC